MTEDLSAEAAAFDTRIKERQANGFVPDLELLTENDYFYKSFWRTPLYADLYVGEMSRTYIKYFADRLETGATILDAGCGPGYFSLELARAGFHVTGVDISGKALGAAEEALEQANRGPKFGSLNYFEGTLQDLEDTGCEPFDGVLSSGFLHHIRDLHTEIASLSDLLRQQGILVLHEPQHHRFSEEDAFWVAVMRLLLAKANVWLDDFGAVETTSQLQVIALDTHREFVLERDVAEVSGQSPNDLSADREQIIQALEGAFELEEITPSRSFIYRTLGGLRGSQEQNRELAKLLTLIDSAAVSHGYLEANYFYTVGRKRT